jgi:hypothetical protein
VRDGTGAVISGALVTATEDHTGRQYRTITDESGSYRFAVVTPGEYSVTYEARGFSTQTKLSVVVAPAVPIRLDILMAIGNTGGSVVETIDNYWENGTRRPGPEIKSTGSISGTVSDDRGVAIPTRITATEQPSLRRYQTTTDSDGVYRLSHLPAGYYCLDFEGAGPSSARSTAIEVRPRHVTEMDLRLSPMETVEVCSGSCMIQTSNLPADSAHQGTALRVYAHSNVVPAGSEAWVIVALTNTSRHSILIHPEEGESPTLGYQMHASGRCNCPGLLHRSEIGPGSGNAHTGLRRDKRHKLRIQPGQTVTERVDLTRMNLDQPGTYTIYAECPDISSAKQGEERKDQPLVRSNAIRVMLLESDKE